MDQDGDQQLKESAHRRNKDETVHAEQQQQTAMDDTQTDTCETDPLSRDTTSTIHTAIDFYAHVRPLVFVSIVLN